MRSKTVGTRQEQQEQAAKSVHRREMPRDTMSLPTNYPQTKASLKQNATRHNLD